MNLPVIIDVALGLIFVYLILSLLASEIQELTAALLQWRAKHLQKSITNLLQGGENLPINEQKHVKELVYKIYDHPLIRNINQVSVEGIASFFRWMTWLLSDFYNWVTHFVKKDWERTFGDQRSAPSYVPAETFATTLLESVGILDLSRLLMQQRFEKFNERLFRVIKSTLEDVLNKSVDAKERVNKFYEELRQAVKDYENSEATLQTCVFRIIESFDRLIAFFENHPSSTSTIKSELQAIKTNYFGEKGERAFLFGLSPSPSELVELVDKGSRVYKEIEPAFKAALNEGSKVIVQQVEQKIAELTNRKFNTNKKSKAELTEENREQFASEAMDSLNLGESDRKTYEVYRTYQKIDDVIEGLPKFVRDSLKVLARRAESRIRQVGTQVQQVGNEVDHLRTEIESWFDRSMDRASGVYKRNSKGFAIVLGFVLAVATNTDTFHIFSRISNDEKLRQVIVQNATSISQTSNFQQGALDTIREQTDEALKVIPLPIGWNPTIVKQQLNCSEQGNDWASLYNCNSARNPSRNKTKSFFIPGVIIGLTLASFLNGAIMLAGWLVTGIAISMGASFWFDLLSKVVNVRNTGKPPTSSTTGQTTSSSQPNAPGS